LSLLNRYASDGICTARLKSTDRLLKNFVCAQITKFIFYQLWRELVAWAKPIRVCKSDVLYGISSICHYLVVDMLTKRQSRIRHI